MKSNWKNNWKNNGFQETSVAIILILLLLLILNPLNIWMPTMIHMMILVALFIVFTIFAVFIVGEKFIDERDSAHRMLAGRIAFLIGCTVLTLGIIVQQFSHQLDPWLIIALVVMVITKIGTHLYSNRNY